MDLPKLVSISIGDRSLNQTHSLTFKSIIDDFYQGDLPKLASMHFGDYAFFEMSGLNVTGN